jgi:hypothetical protein
MTVRIRLRGPGARFVHPMDPMPRTAILAPGFRETKLIRAFPSGWDEDAARFEPSSIAGTPEQLRRWTRVGLQLRHAVIVFTYEGQPELSNADRDFFWKAFGVPVFEQHLGPGNQLLAMECDAHAGLHLAGDFSHLRGDKSSCACGNPAPRLLRRPKFEEPAELSA